MKRFIITIIITIAATFGFASESMTWAEYESICNSYGRDASYADYEELMKQGGQCILIEENQEIETLKLFEELGD